MHEPFRQSSLTLSILKQQETNLMWIEIITILQNNLIKIIKKIHFFFGLNFKFSKLDAPPDTL